ncbi:hypothetical protein BUE80_DR007173 [Diplocarpon rosae]|nr:hypothetical protein BUE80_DR007173 [Diplocarpon rosae]
MPDHEPKGSIITDPPAALPDPTRSFSGQNSISLIPLNLCHVRGLFSSLGGHENDFLYTYLPSEPICDMEGMKTLVDFLIASPVFFPYAIISSSPPQTPTPLSSTSNGIPVGIICYMNLVPSSFCIEIGHVLFGRTLQRTPASTESNYLLMKYAFEELGYHRVEWKANNFNEPSKRAAVRLGFTFEGCFRKHMVVKRRRRDTAWFSCLDEEWTQGVGRALEEWLDEGNFDEEGRQKKKLEEIRGKYKDGRGMEG